jgi:hypothetical protein
MRARMTYSVIVLASVWHCAQQELTMPFCATPGPFLIVRDLLPTPQTFTSDSLTFELPYPYADRFTKALKHAIVLCGGKPSSF